MLKSNMPEAIFGSCILLTVSMVLIFLKLASLALSWLHACTVCVCVCVKPCDPRESSSSHLYVCVQGAQAAHPVLHQRRHWMSAGDIQWDAIGRTCKFLKVGPFSFFPNGFSKQQTCTCMSGSIHVRQTCCVQMWQTCICADMSTNMCGLVAFSCCDMFRSRHVNQ